ncbi:MAG: YARHG domain-containing protein [Agathobacter sp.]|nr:YARHG domain-containing protein [Agathobacter sp.]
MKKCVKCGFENEDMSLFCSECGTKLEEAVKTEVQRFCMNCGSPVEPGTLFCSECGKPLQVQEEKILEAKIINQVAEEVKPAEPKPVAPAPKPAAPVQKKQEAPKTVPTPPPVPAAAVSTPVKEEAPAKKKASIVPIIIVALVLVVVLGLGIFFVFQSGILGGKDSDDDTKVEENIDKDEEDEEESEVTETEEEVDTETTVEVDTTNPIPVAASVSASSYLNDTYSVAALTDANVTTVWAEGVGGFGEGESITYTLQQATDIYGIAILPGDLTNSSNFYSNAYPTELEISNGESSQTVSIAYYTPSFDFSGNPYMFLAFSEPVHGDNITVTINVVNEGSSGQITCITEMHLFTYAEAGSNISVDPNAWSVTGGVVTDGDYILPTSNSEYLTMEDLAGFTAEQCRLARNELYARYGRKFTDESLRTYFESKSWYVGTIEPDDFTEDMLNEYEIFNRDLIVDYEEQNGFR